MIQPIRRRERNVRKNSVIKFVNYFLKLQSKKSREFLPWRICFTLWIGCFVGSYARADDLISDSVPEAKEVFDLETYISQFSNFSFELKQELQAPESFLKRKTGDCDDFAFLMKQVLDENGYSAKLVVVMMEKQTHVVCYVSEMQGYLDYNRRSSGEPITPSTDALEDVADKVAGYFKSEWHMASEIDYDNGSPRYLDSVFH